MTDDPRLRPRPVPAPAAGNPFQHKLPNLPPEGSPPLEAGRVYMSDMVRSGLEAVGWRDGDPIPGDLGEILQEMQNSLRKEAESADIQTSELAVGWTKPKNTYVDILKLPPEKQAEVAKLLADYKIQVENEAAASQQLADMDSKIPPTIQGEQREQLLQQMQKSAAERQAWKNRRDSQTYGTVIDDREKPVPPVPGANQDAAGVSQGTEGRPGVLPPSPGNPPATRLPETAQTETPAAVSINPAIQDAEDTGAFVTPHACPRCQWPADRPFEVVPSVEDKETFIAAVCGQSVFSKRYRLLNGLVVVKYRSLTTADTECVQQQMGALVRSGACAGDAEYLAYMHTYYLALSVARVVVGKNVLYKMEGLEQWAKENPPTAADAMDPTPLPQLVRYFQKHGAPTASIHRVIRNTFNEFQRLVEMLEVMADDPDFYKGIVLRV